MGQRMMEKPEMMMMMKDPTKLKGVVDHMVTMVA
jgi:hypothetical protein